MANPVDIAIWAAKAGWRDLDLTKAVAVSMASGGSAGKPGGLYGLGNEGDPQTQTNHAYARQKAEGWKVFKAFRNKSYLLYVPTAQAAASAAPVKSLITNPGGFVEAAKNTLTDVAKELPGADIVETAQSGLALAYKAGAWMSKPENWIRVMFVMVGGGLIIMGTAVAFQNKTLGAVSAVVGKTVGGTVAKSVGKGNKE